MPLRAGEIHNVTHFADKIAVFAIGAAVGSFLNVCIHRMPMNESVVFPPSRCPKCGKGIRWYGNIPILSYIFLRGRCEYCRKRISLRYPLVEIITAGLIVSLYAAFGISAKFFVYSAFACALIVTTFIDIKTNEIPDSISLGGLASGLLLSALFPALFDTDLRSAGFLNSLAGALTGGILIYAMGIIGRALFKKEAMGGGDVKLMAMIGSILGWKLALFTFFAAPFFGAVAGVIMRIRDGRETMAYGPYLSLAAIIAVFFAKDLLKYFAI